MYSYHSSNLLAHHFEVEQSFVVEAVVKWAWLVLGGGKWSTEIVQGLQE